MITYLAAMISALFILIAVVFMQNNPADFLSSNPIPTIIFGDLRGYFEPCGCNPQTDLGGMKRLGGYVDLMRKQYENLEVFSVGNNFLNHSFRHEEEFIQKGLEVIAPTAMLLGLTEWTHVHELSDQQKSHYLLSHQQLKLGFKQVVQTSQSIIFGLMDHPPHIKVTASDLRAIQSIRQNSSPHQRSVLLLSTTRPAEFFQQYASSLSDFDLIALSHHQSIETQIISPPIHRPSSPWPLYTQFHPRIFQTTMASGAVITWGLSSHSSSAEPQRLSDGAELMSPSPISSNTAVSDASYVWLSQERPISSKMDSIESSYRQTKAQAFEQASRHKQSTLSESQFVGSHSCSGCHLKAYEVWLESQHQKAFETLITKESHTNALCVICHVVGLDQEGGFINETLTPHLKGVGCESCHGPRLRHIQNPRTPPDSKSSSDPWNCESCHHSPHVVNFDIQSWWEKIEHGH